MSEDKTQLAPPNPPSDLQVEIVEHVTTAIGWTMNNEGLTVAGIAAASIGGVWYLVKKTKK